MSHQRNIGYRTEASGGIGSGRDLTEIAALFDADLEFEIQGDAGVLPWIGRSDFPRKQQKRIVLQYREIDLFESGSRMPLGKGDHNRVI